MRPTIEENKRQGGRHERYEKKREIRRIERIERNEKDTRKKENPREVLRTAAEPPAMAAIKGE